MGTKLAVRAGTKLVVSAGLVLLGSAFLWISTASNATPYSEIIGQMVVLGAGLGLTSAPATESIMDVVPREKAGVGSVVNDATRELGATLGVAVIGSVFASLYTRTLDSHPAVSVLPAEVHASARQSIGSALIAAQRVAVVNDQGAAQLVHAATSAFFAGFQAGCLVAGALAFAGAAVVPVILPGAARQTASQPHLMEAAADKPA